MNVHVIILFQLNHCRFRLPPRLCRDRRYQCRATIARAHPKHIFQYNNENINEIQLFK